MKRGIFIALILAVFYIFSVNAQVYSDNLECFKTDSAGDVNDDGVIDISDAIGILFHLYQGKSAKCVSQADVNGDGITDLSDAIFLLNYLFNDSDEPIGIDHPPFLALTPSLNSKIDIVSDEPIPIRLHDAYFSEDDVLFCRGVSISRESGEENELFSLGDWVNPFGSPEMNKYYFILDMAPGSYNVEITCMDSAGNEGRDVTILNLGKTECRQSGFNCRSSCGENEEEVLSGCVDNKVCCKVKPSNMLCRSDETGNPIDICCKTYDQHDRLFFQCLEGCGNKPVCAELNSHEDALVEYDIVTGERITEHSWSEDLLSVCNDINANPPDLPSLARIGSSACSLGISSKIEGEWRPLTATPTPTPSPSPSPSPASIKCRVKNAIIVHKAKDRKPVNYGGDISIPDDLMESQKDEKDKEGGIPGVGRGAWTLHSEEWGKSQEKLKPAFRGKEVLNYGFFVMAWYVGVKAYIDPNTNKLVEEEVNDIDTRNCLEYQFAQSTIKEEYQGKGFDLYYGAVYPYPASGQPPDKNPIYVDASLLKLYNSRLLKSFEEIGAVLDSRKNDYGSTSNEKLGCAYKQYSQEGRLCSDDYFQEKFDSNKFLFRTWPLNFYSVKNDIMVPLQVKDHNLVEADGRKRMYWYDAPGITIFPSDRKRWEETGMLKIEKKSKFTAVIEDEDGLGRIRCDMDPLTFIAGYNPKGKSYSEINLRDVQGPSLCKCYQERMENGKWWPKKDWEC